MIAPAESSAPPRPRALSIIQTLRYVRRPLPLLDECRRDLGEIFTLRLVGSGDWVFLSEPQHLRAMFTGDTRVLHAGEANASIFGALTGTHSAFTLDEDAHLARRRLLSKPFHGDRMHEYTSVMRALAERAVDAWPVDRTFAIHPEVQRIALDVILRAIFGLDRGGEAVRLAGLLERLANEGVRSPLLLAPTLQRDLGRFSPWGRIMRLVRETDAALHDEIRRRRAAPEDPSRRDILALLLAARDDAGRPLTDEELRDELVTMLLAGHETTGTAMAWAFERLLSHPEAYARVEAEIDAATGGGPIEREHVPRLVYLDAVLQETLRIRPIMPIGGTRKLTAPFEVGGFVVPAGATVTNCMYLALRRAEAFPDPEKFLPERFLGKAPDLYEWTPFGGGVRRCLGMAFAMWEMKVVIATVLSRVRLRIDATNVRAMRRGFFLAPEGGPPVRVTERRVAAGKTVA
jgi:cytochrome P450